MRFGTVISVVLVIVFIASPALARTWYILPDGTGDAPTIAAGMDSASRGDTVLVACGTYYIGYWGDQPTIWMKSGVCLRSETGLEGCARI